LKNRTVLHLKTISLLAALLFSGTGWAIGQCPAVGQSPSCAALITINPDGSLKIQVDPSVPPYDGVEDSLVGVINNSGASVFGIKLTGQNIFGLDGDGAFGGNYEGPGTSFSVQDANNGIVNFTNSNGLGNGKFAYFSLEGPPTGIKLSSTITIDPGHGTNCAAVSQLVGAIGSKIYPANNPPAGPLMEDKLTVAVALQLQPLLAGDSYTVKMTKSAVASCPTFLERTKLANDARSNMFVSIHFDAPAKGLSGVFKSPGSLGIYNSTKKSAATLAQFVANNTASALGVNNRGIKVDDSLAVLKTTTSRMTAIIIEVARLSAPDDDIVHASGATALAANGIRAGINGFINQ
jgi:N-acetylmuramoyl-L-alanine amidase